MSDHRYVILAHLAAAGLTPADVATRCPHTVEYTALDGSPCWRREDLVDLLGDDENGEDPS